MKRCRGTDNQKPPTTCLLLSSTTAEKLLVFGHYSLHPGSVIGTDLGRVAPIALFQQMGTHDEDWQFETGSGRQT